MATFLDVTREERFFCTLLVHATLSDGHFRNEFVHRLAEASETPLRSSSLELYTEVAWLRDYWFALGDFNKYHDELDQRRESQLRRVLEVHLGDAEQAQHVLTANFIRTKTGKIQSPGRWSLPDITAFTQIEARGREPGDALVLDKQLRELKWAYNAKPDVLVVSGGHPVLVEAKVESGIDFKKSSGYNQARISQTIRRLMHVVADSTVVDTQSGNGFSGIAFISRKVEKDPETGDLLPTILWEEVASWAEASPGLDQFTREGLRRFAERAQAKDLQTD